MSYRRYWLGKRHIQVKSDNITAIAYMNNMGRSVSEKSNELAKHLWYFCIQGNIWISAVHITGKENTADYMSRSLSDNTEWQLATVIFKNIVHTFNFVPELDLFASYLNAQFPSYVSWFPDPSAVANDAFSLSWKNKKVYAFPPFILIGPTLSKIRKEQSTGIMLVSWWGTQFRFPLMLLLLINFPIQLPKTKNTLTLPSKKGKFHPLHPKLKLLAILLSGRQSAMENFHKKLRKLSQTHGEHPQDQGMSLWSNDGSVMHYRRMRIPILLI